MTSTNKNRLTSTFIPTRSANPTALSYIMAAATIVLGFIPASIALWAAIIAIKRRRDALTYGALIVSLVAVLYACVQLYFAYALSQLSF